VKFFVDTADLNDIKELAASGLLDGVTTNPSLIAKSGRNFVELIKGVFLSKLAKNIAVKVPLTPAGLRVCKALSSQGTMVNVTLCFSAAQAILAAKAGATFVSPFVGRLDDIGQDGLRLIEEICQIYEAQGFETEVLVASVRHPIHVTETAKMGAHVATMPPSVIRQLFNHPLTEKGLAQFVADWAKTGQSILPKTAA
jgi:transaldolase